MSTIMYRIRLEKVITAEDAGKEFATTTSDVQAKFLESMSSEIGDFSNGWWPNQCIMIAEEIPEDKRESITKTLLILAEAIKNENDK